MIRFDWPFNICFWADVPPDNPMPDDPPPDPEKSQPSVDDILTALTASGEFEKNTYQDFRFTVQKVTNFEEYNKVIQDKAKDLQPIVDKKADIDKQIRERIERIRAIRTANPNIDVKKLQELVDNDATIKALKASLLALAPMVAAILVKYDDKIKTVTQKAVDLSSICCGGSLDMTDDKLAEGRADFWDPGGELFGALELGDYVNLMLGWKDSDSPRYRLQPVFKGIITDKNHSGSDNSPSITSFSYQDERCLGNDTKMTDIFGIGGINDSSICKDMMNKCGVVAVADNGNDRDSISVNKQSSTTLVNNLRNQNGNSFTPIVDPETGETTVYILPKSIKDKYFYYAWGVNIQTLSFTKRAQSASDKTETGSPDTLAGEPPSNGGPETQEGPTPAVNFGTQKNDPPKTPATTPPLGNDLGGGTEKQDKKANEAIALDLSKAEFTSEFCISLEPQLNNMSIMYVDNYNPYCIGLWEIIQVTQKFGDAPATTTAQARKLLLPDRVENLDQLIMEHQKTNKYTQTTKISKDIGESGRPNFNNRLIESYAKYPSDKENDDIAFYE